MYSRIRFCFPRTSSYKQWSARARGTPANSASPSVPGETPIVRGRSAMQILLRQHSWGIQARLTMLALVTAVPLVVGASFAILRTVDDQRAQIQSNVQQIVENTLAEVDREISAIQTELQALATSPSLQTGDLMAFDR